MSKDHYVHDTGKGSRPRPVDKEKYDANYERIFGKKSQSGCQNEQCFCTGKCKEVESVFICMHCGVLNEPTDSVCKNCGSPAGTYPGDSNRI